MSLEPGNSVAFEVKAAGAVAGLALEDVEVDVAAGVALAGAGEPKANPPEGGAGIPSRLTAEGVKLVPELAAPAGAPEPKEKPEVGGCGIAEDFVISGCFAGGGVFAGFSTGLSADG